MGLLDQFSPGQRQALMVGAPVAAALAIGSIVRNRGAAEEDAADEAAVPAGSMPDYMPSTDAIGVGELSEILTGQADALTELLRRVPQTPPEAAVPVVIPKAKPRPAAKPRPRALPWRARGEVTADVADRPGHPGQVWYLSNYGGVQALGGAPFFGAAYNGGRGTERFREIRATAGGNGYYLISNRRNIHKGR